MLKKYNDTPAAIALALFTLGSVFYVAQLLFMTEAWLAENGMGQSRLCWPVSSVLPGLALPSA